LENLKERDNSEDLDANGRLMLEWNLRELEWGGVDWMQLAQNRTSGGLL